MAEIPDKLIEARLKAKNAMPYFAHGLMNMLMIEDERCWTGDKKTGRPTMGVDKYWRCYYHPGVLEQWDKTTIAGVLIHEVSHLIRKHWKRALADHDLWNVATDCEINDDIQNGNELKLPEDGCIPSKFKLQDHELAEWYYKEIMKQQKRVQAPSFGGSCADGSRRPWEGPEDNDCISEEYGDAIITAIAKDIKANKQQGSIGANLQRWAELHLKPQVNWRQHLRNLVKRAIAYVRGHQFTDYSVPSRRQHPNFIMAGRVEPTPRVTLLIDTSGSMGQSELSQALAEVQGLLKSIPTQTIRVISGDTDAKNDQNVNNANQVVLKGGGGTALDNIVHNHIKENSTDVLIYLTDGYTGWAKPMKGVKQIAVIINSKEPTPKHITPVYVENNLE